ncbi:hypothetical protein [Microbulbifer hainanensis]|uniref:hypothetical protein n=1 Tax=Microbulbifer hainanensis TaxID=2735675 RepID=UPI001866E721|nr:hypothetical protein [Microbulbifer hainanensis]
MALWKQALAKLRGAADEAKPSGVEAESGGDGELDVLDEIPAAEGEDTAPEPKAVDKQVLARELQSGIEVSLGDLEFLGAGWRYRGHPVMVFGADVRELEASQQRDFFSQIHLYPCSGVLQNETVGAWVGTDLEQINAGHGQGPFRLCRACLEAAAGRGADAARFDFASHVRSHGDSYFADAPCYWQPGANSEPLQAPASRAEGDCPHCGCRAEEGGWQLASEDAQRLELPVGSCLLCAERRVKGCLHLTGEELLGAARVRYQYLVSQAAKVPAPSWRLAEAILPLGWQPLLQSLQRVLPPPELFYVYAESAQPAVLAWPSLRRGIVESVGGTEETIAEEWSLWTRGQIEAELGFKLR